MCLPSLPAARGDATSLQTSEKGTERAASKDARWPTSRPGRGRPESGPGGGGKPSARPTTAPGAANKSAELAGRAGSDRRPGWLTAKELTPWEGHNRFERVRRYGVRGESPSREDRGSQDGGLLTGARMARPGSGEPGRRARGRRQDGAPGAGGWAAHQAPDGRKDRGKPATRVARSARGRAPTA